MKVSKNILWVVGLGIGLRALLWCFQATPEGDDGLRYLSESVNMVKYGVFSAASFLELHGTPTPSAHDLPLWPSIMALVYWATESIRATQYIAGAINILFCFCAALLLILLLRHKPFEFTDRQVIAALCVYLFMPDSVMYSLFHMPDQLAVTSILLSLCFLFRGVYCNQWYLIGAALSFVIAIYAKPICIPLSMALILSLVLLLRCAIWKRIVLIVALLLCIGACLYPWVVRNKMAFGTSGLTSISGTNLYGCNWGRLVATFSEKKQWQEKSEMRIFEESIANDDLMLRSKKQGEYARRKIMAHLSEYAIFTMKTHPRMYAGTGTVAMFRYLGCESISNCLDGMFGAKNVKGDVILPVEHYSIREKIIGAGVQLVSWLVLSIGYSLVLIGLVNGARWAVANANRYDKVLVFLCPVLSLVLLAAVIGPITATRYRFVMIPFFSIVAGYSFIPKPCID